MQRRKVEVFGPRLARQILTANANREQRRREDVRCPAAPIGPPPAQGRVRASREDLARYDGRSYEDAVEELIHPERVYDLDEDILSRYMPHTSKAADATPEWNARWMYRMINSPRPLEEKMALFWHHVFATGWTKSEHTPTMIVQIQMFREFGLANLRRIFIELSRDPAMIYWLDNCENHAGSINENYGRELLELFSMGIGNYTESDIKNVARAFTGWTFEQPLPLYPYGHYGSGFVYRPDDHDGGEKTFLGHTGNFNGEDIIEIIVNQEATAKFISRHLYNFFVADVKLRCRPGASSTHVTRLQ